MTQETPATKEITITHGNGSTQTLTVAYDFDESSIVPVTKETFDSSILQKRVEDSLKYLTETDWYVSRKAETGADIPQDILLKRQQLREFISVNRNPN